MESYLVQHEPWLRLSAFGAVLAAMALWELRAPRRALGRSRLQRWPANLGLIVLNTALLRLILPMTAIGLAALATERGWGVLNPLALPPWLALAAAVAALDLAMYFQHVLFHAVPALWRLHRVHHADSDFDVTTGVRFHPAEMLISALIKLGAVAALGPPVLAVLVFEVLLNATSMFNHGNVRLPLAADRLLRRLIVTPDMHRVHHSAVPRESNSNFGFALSWWDRLFGTYLAQPAAGHERMTIGVSPGSYEIPLHSQRSALRH
jgi:sterol desaturase/sphingolipid hydroxylase (fatty acid hydroxylase superfamily)